MLAIPTDFLASISIETIGAAGAIVLAIALVIAFKVFGPVLNLHLQARVSGVHVTLGQLASMHRRGRPVRMLVISLIRLHKAGLMDIRLEDLDAHDRAGGNVIRGAVAMLGAKGSKRPLQWQQAARFDLAGRLDELPIFMGPTQP